MISKTTIFIKKYRIVLLIAFLFGTTSSFGQVLTVIGNGNTIANNDITPSTGDNTDFGTITKDTKLTKSFIIKNIGSADLTFASTVANRVVISGVDADQFVITVGVGYATAPLVLIPATYMVMEISFQPTSIGLKNATITLGSNNLSDTTYSFNIRGNGSIYSTPTFKRTVLAPALNYPTNLYVGPDNYLWISERAGKKISRISKDGTIVDEILDLSSIVYQTVTQDGLLGMVLHPDLGKGLGSDYVYVAYTYNNGSDGMSPTTGFSNPTEAEKLINTATNPYRQLRIVRYNYSVSGSDGTLSSPVTVIEGLTGGNDHNSGRLLFGPDNKLYYTVGDHGHNQGGGRCNPVNSQNIPSAADLVATPPNYTFYQGKSLRLNLDGTIPADNPTINGVQSHIFTYGHRNASGLTFGNNGLLYSSEHGPNYDDELNILESGNNYGWPNVSGYNDDKNYKYLSLSQYIIDNSISCPSATEQTALTALYGALESSWLTTFTNPISTWTSTIDNVFNSSIGAYSWPTIAPSNIKIYDDFAFEIPGWNNSIFTTTLKKGRVYRQKLSTDGRSIVGQTEELFETTNRYRDIAFDPNGKIIYLITDTAGNTSVVINDNNIQEVSDKGKIIVYTYEETPTACSVPVADLVSLTPLSDPCCIVKITPPTATSNCSSTGGIIGTTSTVFPITSSQTITWTYTNCDGSFSTQDQTVTITNPSTTWNGSWSNGTPSATTTAIINANITITADLAACSLIVDNNANVTVNSAFKVTLEGSLVVKPGSSFTLNNNAALYQTNATAINTGNITVKRNSSSLMLNDYTIWSSPVANQTFSLFSPLTVSSRFYTYNSAFNYFNVTNATIPTINNFETGKGYLIRMPNNHPTTATIWEGNFIGVPNNGDKTVAITGSGPGLRFNSVGNPYPSPISISTFINNNRVTGDIRIRSTIYFWRKTNGVVGTAYCTHTTTVYTTNGNPAAVDPGGIIQTGQGFIVESQTNNNSVQFKNSQRVSNTANQFFKTKEAKNNISTLWLNATDDSGAFSQMAVTYNAEATLDVDSHDGIYINDSDYALSSLLDNEEYVIQGRPSFDVTDEVPLVFKTPKAGNYKIAIDHTEGVFSGNQDIILRDNLTGAETNLKSSAYTFLADAVVDNARFTLKYQKTLGIASNELKENRLLVISKDGSVQIKSDITNLKEVLVHDISGRLLFKKQGLNTLGITIESAKFGNQVLIVTMTTQDKKVISKKILN